MFIFGSYDNKPLIKKRDYGDESSYFVRWSPDRVKYNLTLKQAIELVYYNREEWNLSLQQYLEIIKLHNEHCKGV